MTPTNGTGPRPTRSTPIRASSARTAPTRIGERGWLTYAYVPPNEDFTQRYLVVHEIALTPHADARRRHKCAPRWRATRPPTAGCGPRWRRRSKKARAPSRREDARRSHDRAAARAFREARGMRARERGRAGLSSGQRRCDAGYKRQRTAGFVYRDAQPGTAALYACAAPRGYFISRRWRRIAKAWARTKSGWGLC